MILSVAALICLRWSAIAGRVADIDALAKARDADAMMAYAGPEVKALGKPFFFLKANGPYGTGRFGWNAIPLTAPGGGQYLVFSTKITSEDYGEFLFHFDGEKLLRYLPESDPLGFRIEHQKLDVRFDIPAKTAKIESVVSFVPHGVWTRPPAIAMVRLSPHYRVSNVRDAQGRPVSFSQAGGVVAMRTPSNLGERPRFSYRLTYQGVVDLPRFAGSITGREALLTNDYWYPMTGRLPATYEATIHAPKDWFGVAQGELVKDVHGPNERVTTWRMDLPASYWSLSAAPYRTSTTEIDGRKFTVWSLSMTPEQMRLQAELTAPIIDFYSKAFAAYPFSTWGAVDSPQYGGGALEAYSFATYGSGWLPDDDDHEPAHTWWGGMINNTYFNSLWNESFANFSGGLYRREGPIGNRSEKRLAFVSEANPGSSYSVAPMSQSGVFIGPASSSLGYGRGADVLQMLEVELGTETMIAAMRDWLKNNPKGEPGEWEGFEAAAKRASGRDLKTFFDEWVRRPGYADFTIENVRWESGSVRGEAVFRSEPYHLLCEVMLQMPGGRREFKTVRFEPNGKRASLSIPADGKPELVSFDPWRRILRPKRDDERPAELVRTLRRMKRYVDPRHTDWLGNVPAGEALTQLPSNLDGVFLVGSPENLPVLKVLCDAAGFQIRGNDLEFDGTTVDLSKSGALALIDLPGGGQCAIGLGKTRRPPKLGRARTIVYDDLGRFLRGRTDPKTSGFLTFRL